jgi:hypothetical protein
MEKDVKENRVACIMQYRSIFRERQKKTIKSQDI